MLLLKAVDTGNPSKNSRASYQVRSLWMNAGLQPPELWTPAPLASDPFLRGGVAGHSSAGRDEQRLVIWRER